MKILVTGVAGFIGSHVAARLLGEGSQVTGLDNLNSYYDPSLKRARLAPLLLSPSFEFAPLDITARRPIEDLFASHDFDLVIHLAAQAGVRYSVRKSSRLCRYQRDWISSHPGRVPPGKGGTPPLRFFQFCVWRKHQDSVCGGRSGGSSCFFSMPPRRRPMS